MASLCCLSALSDTNQSLMETPNRTTMEDDVLHLTEAHPSPRRLRSWRSMDGRRVKYSNNLFNSHESNKLTSNLVESFFLVSRGVPSFLPFLKTRGNLQLHAEIIHCILLAKEGRKFTISLSLSAISGMTIIICVIGTGMMQHLYR